MDRSFLSDKAVIAASRNFVCARLATYESAEEGKMLAGIFRGRSGELENTVFTILAPDGKKRLVRSSRGPHMTFGRDGSAARDMVAAMKRIAKTYPGKRGGANGAPLPLTEDVRLGINIAACDRLPLVVVVGKDAKDRVRLERALAPLAWAEANLGRFLYASTYDVKDLKSVTHFKKTTGYTVVAPGRFGQDGAVLVQIPPSAKTKVIQAALDKALKAFKPNGSADHRRHVREGKRAGVKWETEIPVTDPGRPPRAEGRRGPPR